MDLLTLKNVAKFVSAIGIALSFFMLIPIGAGIAYHEDVRSFLFFDLSLFLLNLSIFGMLYRYTMQMRIKDSILSVNLIWILLGIAGGIPLYLYTHITMADAFFEAISGFTTTGATIYTDIESLPKSIMMLRSLMHWLGGMGIIVLGVGLFSLINPTGSLTMFKAESTGIKMEKITPKIKDTALRLWIIYLIFTFADTVLLEIGGMNLFDAINHAFSTISTGGFSTKNASLGFWGENYFILWVTTLFMFLSGINFLAHLRLWGGDVSGYASEEVKWYTTLFLLLSIALSLVHFRHSHDTLGYSLTHGFLTISSILTTTGFASLDYESWGTAAVAVVFVAMFIGGNAGSTAGGMKVIRYIVLFKNLFAQIRQILHPNAVVGIYIDKGRITSKILGSVSGFLLLFVLTNALVTLYLHMRGYDPMTSISTAIACVGNIGPGFSLTGPAQNYHFFSGTDKILLSFAMIIGRLEFYTVMILFVRDFWRKY
ncbi:MAG: potassium transporter [Campylobacteraceae bacterium 4484_4]|nr:MAG: potassium transporter [Campylobacteraceae bacterium 4484_4]